MTELLSVSNLSKIYKAKHYWLNRRSICALEPISFTLQAQQTLAIIGSIGSGKSTLAKLLVGAEIPTTGTIKLNGQLLTDGDFSERCQHIRMIFQESSTTLNPSLTIEQLLDEPLILNTNLDKPARQELIRNTLHRVGLLAEHLNFYPHMLSGGQKQRISLARAIILSPQIIILDESLASLDPTLRAQMINLLLDLQQQMGLAYILISQNLGIVRHLSDQLLVLVDGRLVEHGVTQKVLRSPRHPYTKKLILSQQLHQHTKANP
jgi:cationic peptide transport system ATP-binding protein